MNHLQQIGVAIDIVVDRAPFNAHITFLKTRVLRAMIGLANPRFRGVDSATVLIVHVKAAAALALAERELWNIIAWIDRVDVLFQALARVDAEVFRHSVDIRQRQVNRQTEATFVARTALERFRHQRIRRARLWHWTPIM